MIPNHTQMLNARISANRMQMYNRLAELMHAFDLEDLSMFTDEQQTAIRRARKTLSIVRGEG